MKTITTFFVFFFVCSMLVMTINAQDSETPDQKLERINRERERLNREEEEALMQKMEDAKKRREAAQQEEAALQQKIEALKNSNRNVPSTTVTPAPSPSASTTVTDASVAPTPAVTPTPQPSPENTAVLTPEAQASFDKNVRDLASQILRAVPNPNPKPRITIVRHTNELLPLIAAKVSLSNQENVSLTNPARDKDALLDVEAARTDKLLGANAKASGTTSLVSKGGIPLIFSLAVETGAAVSSTSGTSTTFQFNPIGILDRLSGQPPPIEEPEIGCKSETGLRQLLCRTAIGVTFDISRGTDVPTFTGSREQLSQISFRYGFVNKREPNLEDFRFLTATFINNVAIPVSKEEFGALTTLLENIDSPGGQIIQKWITDTNVELANLQLQSVGGNFNHATVRDANIKAISDVINKRLNVLPVAEIKKEANISGAISRFATADELYERAKTEYLRKLYRESMFTFEYVNDRELNSPDSSNFRLIYEKGFGGGKIGDGVFDFTFNGSFTVFHSRPDISPTFTAEQRAKFKILRDFSFAAQLDFPLSNLGNLEDSYFSLAAKYQRMNTDAFTFNNMTFTDLKGDIWVGQAKLNIALGKSGLFLPFSVTFANRSELIKEKKTRGNFGFTFDVSSLLERCLTGGCRFSR